jgi:phosphoadenosine phosphosulfate reductase
VLVGRGRCRSDDLAAWEHHERMDAAWSSTQAFARRVARAKAAALSCAAKGNCYAGTSWGKDSTVLAHLLVGTATPIVWVRVEPLFNPDCLIVRDEFLRQHDINYHEVTVTATRGPDRHWLGTGRLEEGFSEAARRFGTRYLSGIRGAESGPRKQRMKFYGIESKNTCAPIGYWQGMDVFAYLYANGLPVHPAYACTMRGAYERERLRVATLGGDRGTEHGRRAWEYTYYPEEMRAIFDGYAHVPGTA